MKTRSLALDLALSAIILLLSCWPLPCQVPPPRTGAGAVSESLGAALMARFKAPAALLVVREGRTLAEWYAAGKGPSDRIPLNATAMIVSAALFGTALQQGFIPSADAKVEEVLGKPHSGDDRFHALTFRHFLDNTTGLSGYEECWWSGEAVKYAYKSRMGHSPGEFWVAASEDFLFVTEAVALRANMSIEAYARRYLLEPLGITDFPPLSDRQGYYMGWGAIGLRAQDLAKVAGLFLDDGVYQGKRLLPPGFGAEALSVQAAIPEDRRPARRIEGMGYWWYVLGGPPPAPCVSAGFGGSLDDALQLLVYVEPRTRTVVIIWAPDADSSLSQNDYIEFVEGRVLPAL